MNEKQKCIKNSPPICFNFLKSIFTLIRNIREEFGRKMVETKEKCVVIDWGERQFLLQIGGRQSNR